MPGLSPESTRALMSRSVDADRQPARDREPTSCQVCSKARRVVAAAGSGIARADDRELRQRQDCRVATDEQSDRRVAHLGQQQWVVFAIERDEVMRVVFEPLQLRSNCGVAVTAPAL